MGAGLRSLRFLPAAASRGSMPRGGGPLSTCQASSTALLPSLWTLAMTLGPRWSRTIGPLDVLSLIPPAESPWRSRRHSRGERGHGLHTPPCPLSASWLPPTFLKVTLSVEWPWPLHLRWHVQVPGPPVTLLHHFSSPQNCHPIFCVCPCLCHLPHCSLHSKGLGARGHWRITMKTTPGT